LNDYLSSLYIQSYVELKQYEQLTAFKQNYLNPQSLESLTSYNCINLSFANIQLKEYDEALKLLNRAVELNEDYYALNNRGFVLNILGDYAAAKQDLNKACEIDPASAYAVTNRAYSNVKLGLLDEALVDINKSMELNDGNSYIYLVQGMYQLETGSPQNALANFERAKKLNSTTVLVDEYITLAKSRLIAAQA
jgi:tetratricopeptide (TPR) repeat protein